MRSKNKKYILLAFIAASLFFFSRYLINQEVGNENLTSFEFNSNELLQVDAAAETIVFTQDFNDETPADYYGTGDNTYRLPDGWMGNSPGIFPGGSFCYPFTSAAIGAFSSTNLGIADAQIGMYAYAWRTFPKSIVIGSFEYSYFMRGPTTYVHQDNLILESSTGTDLITISAIKPGLSDQWTLYIEGENAGTYTKPDEFVNIKVEFNGTHADFFVNGTQILSEIEYTPGTIRGVQINTGPIGSSTQDGIGHYDDFVLKVIYPDDSISPVVTILSPVNNATYGINVPNYAISIEEDNLDQIWYTIDNGATNNSITELSGTIDKTVWDGTPFGILNLTFYARDYAGHEGFATVMIVRVPPRIPGFSLWTILSAGMGVCAILIRKIKKIH